MTTHQPPEDAVAAMFSVTLTDPTTGQQVPASHLVSQREATAMLSAALSHLLPGLYVVREPNGDATIREENSPARPHRPWPTAMLQRTTVNARFFDAVAALLPDRTEEALRDALADSAAGLTADLGDFTRYAEEDPR